MSDIDVVITYLGIGLFLFGSAVTLFGLTAYILM